MKAFISQDSPRGRQRAAKALAEDRIPGNLRKSDKDPLEFGLKNGTLCW